VRKPVPPFPQHLQQESNRKIAALGPRTQCARPGGSTSGASSPTLRTDSVHLSDSGDHGAPAVAWADKLWPRIPLPGPRQFTTKSRNAQEAHEAIRRPVTASARPRDTGARWQGSLLYELNLEAPRWQSDGDARLTMLSVSCRWVESQFPGRRQAH